MNFQELLAKHKACKEARSWAGDKTAEQAWERCSRADWMLWLVSRVMDKQEIKQEIVRAAAEIARTSSIYAKDQRVRDCAAAIDRWLAGERVDLQAVEAAAWKAVREAIQEAMRGAANDDAVWSAWSVRAAVEAVLHADDDNVDVAWTLADAAAWVADARHQNITSIVRKHLPWDTIQPLLERAMKDST